MYVIKEGECIEVCSKDPLGHKIGKKGRIAPGPEHALGSNKGYLSLSLH